MSACARALRLLAISLASASMAAAIASADLGSNAATSSFVTPLTPSFDTSKNDRV